MNSSVFRLKSRSLGFVYDVFMENAPMNMRRFHGDQDWIWDQLKAGTMTYGSFGQMIGYMSYKWEMRDRADLACG